MSRHEGSIGVAGTSRRGPLRDHVPYRGDDLAHGKKTGKQLQDVTRDSDGIEDFRQVLTQADGAISPIARKNKRKSTGRKSTRRGAEPEPDDEPSTGFEDMDIDDDEETITHSRTKPSRVSSAPPSQTRFGKPSSKLGRKTDVDYDSIPNPASRARPSTHHTSSVSHNNDVTSRNKSMEATPGRGRDAHSGYSNSMNQSLEMSFTTMNQDDDPFSDPNVEKENRSTFGHKTTIGGAEDVETFEEAIQDIEDRSDGDISGGRGRFVFEEREVRIEVDQDDFEEENEAEEKRALVKPKPAARKKPPAKKPKPKPVRRLVEEDAEENEEDTTGLRRGTRRRFAPLDWWRCEKVVYGRRESGRHLVPVIKEIIRIPKDEPEPLSKKARRRPPQATRRRLTASSEWDAETPPQGVVLDFDTGEEVERRVIFTAAMVHPKFDGKEQFMYQKIFGDGEFIAAGHLVIPPKGEKPLKGTKDNTYVFCLLEGQVVVRVHETEYRLASGGMFLVPRGNNYYIKNVSITEATIFFAQARKIPVEELESLVQASNDPSLVESQ